VGMGGEGGAETRSCVVHLVVEPQLVLKEPRVVGGEVVAHPVMTLQCTKHSRCSPAVHFSSGGITEGGRELLVQRGDPLECKRMPELKVECLA
jgi:hypothetical protein